VVVNNKREVDAKGNVKLRPFTEPERAQLLELVQNAVGYDKDRGDSVNLVNTAFNLPKDDTIPELPLWKQPENIELAKEVGRYMLMAIVGAFMWFGYIRPALNKVSGPPIRVVDSAEMKALAGREIIAGEESELEGLNQDAPQEMTPEEKAAAEAEKLKQELESDETLPKDPVEREIELLRRLNQKYPQLISGIIRQWIND
jgi:flagellar M-ring protein FliF